MQNSNGVLHSSMPCHSPHNEFSLIIENLEKCPITWNIHLRLLASEENYGSAQTYNFCQSLSEDAKKFLVFLFLNKEWVFHTGRTQSLFVACACLFMKGLAFLQAFL